VVPAACVRVVSFRSSAWPQQRSAECPVTWGVQQFGSYRRLVSVVSLCSPASVGIIGVQQGGIIVYISFSRYHWRASG
jgi:hypothetical protein